MVDFNIADLWEGVVDELGPDGWEAVVVATDGSTTRRFTHVELEARSNQLAHHLTSIGVSAGDRVAANLYNGHEFVELTLATFKLRAVLVNLNYRYGVDEIRYVLDDAGVVAVVSEVDLAERALAAAPGLPILTRGPDYEAALAAQPADRPDAGPRSADDLYLVYTGGTTGMPKGVMWRHEDLCFAALGLDGAPRQGIPRLERPELIGPWARAGVGMRRRMPLSPLMHGLGHWTTLLALLTGGCAVLSTDRRFVASSALRTLADERVEITSLIGDAHARPIVDELARHGDLYDLSALRMITSSGAVLSPSVQAALSDALPHLKVMNRFGASETAAQGRLLNSPGGGEAPRLAQDGFNAVFDEHDRPVEPGSGVVGRLARGGHIPVGYWNDPEKTAATFKVIDGRRWSIPGDMATVQSDGSILVHGRGSMVINTGGEKVFPEEVESAVKSHPAVFDAVAVGVPDERFGSRVAVVISLRPGATAPSVDELRSHCETTIASYKAPRVVVVADEVQRTAVNKADYAWAKQYALDNHTSP